MQQIQKVHTKRIEYWTVNLVYWNYNNTAGQILDLFDLQWSYAGETTLNAQGVQETFATRQFELNLGDKAQITKI